eukprot:3708887-Alexandrium_andersonii.AAC.1
MDEAAVPAGPAGRSVPVQDPESAEKGGSEVSALRAEGAARRPATEGVPVLYRFHALDKCVSSCGVCWDCSQIHMECRPLLDLSQCV